MLSDQIMAYGVIFLLIFMLLGGVLCIGMVFASFDIQSEAQSIAMSEGHYGGYTSAEQVAVEQYISTYDSERAVSASEPTALSVSAPGNPVPYGTNVTATLSLPYAFEIGSFLKLPPITLTGTGRSVSDFVQGMTPDVAYVSP